MGDRRFEGKEHAVAYLKYRVTPNELIPEVVDFLQRKSAGPLNLAVDVGCGSGQGTILLAPYFTKVVGTDISPAQLEMAMTNSNPPNVSYRQCPAEELPLAAGEADLVAAFIAAHWFDRPRFLQEADRVLRPGGCLALLSYTMDFDLEYGNVTEQLNHICKEFYAALLPYRSATLGLQSRPLYKDMFDAWPYPDKEWHECVPVRKPMPLDAYVCMVETFSSYQALLQQNPAEATRLSAHIRDKLQCAMGTSSLDTEVVVVVVVKWFYWLSCKPSP